MSDAAAPADRPGPGAVMAEAMASAAERREGRRDLRPLGRLWPHVRAHGLDAALALVFLLGSTSATLGLSWALRFMADKGFAPHSYAALNRAFVPLVVVVGALAAATALRFYFISKLGERVVADLRKEVLEHALALDQTYFLQIRTGEVLARLTTDMTIVENMVGSSVSIALRNLLMLIGALALLIVVTPRYTIFVLLLAPLVIAPLFVFGRRVRRLSVRAQDRFADAMGYAGESLDALETVQAFGREKSVAARFGAAVETAFAASVDRIRARAFMTGLVMVLIFSGVGAILYLATSAVFVQHAMTAGVLLQFIFLAVLAASSVGQLGEVMGDVQKAAGAMDRISELLDAAPIIAAPANPLAFPEPARGEVAFEHVDFAYPGRSEPALSDFSLAVRPGERIALVGPSGAGKSTVFRLLLRFYDPTAGVVRIDGVDLTKADPAAAREHIALVAQDAPLFSGSAAENLRFGREAASLEEVEAAARAAQAYGFVSSLPEGFDTRIGERAKTLSGGERQRLAIARALVRGAPILLLDEATSALDAENERLVQQALSEAMTGRTTLVIAHRLATVLKADRIVVMDKGRIVEAGDHTSLSAQGGLYARLAELQFGIEI
jgi:ATP-binding cassette subfamily B protein